MHVLLKSLSSLRSSLSKISSFPFSTLPSASVVLMLNIGGPSTKEEIAPFLIRFMSDKTIIRIPFNLGPLIGKLRGPYKVQKQYEKIGGFSPILEWTRKQGKKVEEKLNKKFQENNEKFYCYPAFRYGTPLFHDSINSCFTDHGQNIKRIILFSQFPQYSCTTSGNIIRECLDYFDQMGVNVAGPEIKIIDRWFYNQKYLNSTARMVRNELEKFDEKERDDVLILFTAHSLPYNYIKEGDPYSIEISATADSISSLLGRKNPYKLCWQSKVGFQEWLGPSTFSTLETLGKRGFKHLVIVPLGFTSDHLETLYEIDIEYVHYAKKMGFEKVMRAASLNDDEEFTDGLAEVVEGSILRGEYESKNRRIKCFKCPFDICNKLCSK